MKVIMDQKVYEMTKKQIEGVLNVVRKQIPFGIYAVKKDDTCELKKEKFSDKEKLKLEVAEYTRNGFKVYYNGGT